METFRVTPEDAERHPGIPVGARAVVVEGCVHVLSPSAYVDGDLSRPPIGVRITWQRVTPSEEDDGDPEIEEGWYWPGRRYYSADDTTAAKPILFDEYATDPEEGGPWAAFDRVCEEYGADKHGDSSCWRPTWADVYSWDIDYTTGAETSLSIHPVYSEGK